MFLDLLLICKEFGMCVLRSIVVFAFVKHNHMRIKMESSKFS